MITDKPSTILIKNIYYMLAYAFNMLNMAQYESVAGEEFDNIQNLMTAILASGVNHQLKRGMYKEYIYRRESIATLRGRINIPGTIKNKIAQVRKLDCEFDELDENNIYNQIIKTVSMLLIRCDDVDKKYKNDLKRAMAFLSHVDEVDLGSVNWSGLMFHKNNFNYRVLVSVCQFIYYGLLSTDGQRGKFKFARFWDERPMSALYEKFILEYYKREYRGKLGVSTMHIKWATDDEYASAGTMLPMMKTDITLQKQCGNHRNVLIIDAKYYTRILKSQFKTTGKISSDNMFQIFSYVTNHDATLTKQGTPHRVGGILLYAKTDEITVPRETHNVCGNQISIDTLDLNTQFGDIRNYLNKIADDFFNLGDASGT